MLTDVFFRRYQDVVLWTEFNDAHRIFNAQASQIITKGQLFPIVDGKSKTDELTNASLENIHTLLCREMGLSQLGMRAYSYQQTWNGQTSTYYATYSIADVISNFMNEAFQPTYSPDKYMKFRISLIELAFRNRDIELAAANARLQSDMQEADLHQKQIKSAIRIPVKFSDSIKASSKLRNRNHSATINELNTRFQQAGIPLHYHNGFIQASADKLTQVVTEQPFWDLVGDALWENVDTDMKEALDRRDNGDRDPALYAARALESTIKIISDSKGFSRGAEKGAASYINNLVSTKNGRFIEVWEGDLLISFFSKVRNPLGHGPGMEVMPKLTAQQTNWAIETCMNWIKSLIQRM